MYRYYQDIHNQIHKDDDVHGARGDRRDVHDVRDVRDVHDVHGAHGDVRDVMQWPLGQVQWIP